MYEKCLNEAELILSNQQDPLMPVCKVWEEIVTRSKIKRFEVASLSDFSAMLEGDNRFQIVPAQKKTQEDEEIPPDIEIEDSEMEQLGFLSEDRVKLRSKRIIDSVVSEDEEEVGSIRRKAFAGQTSKSKNIPINKKTTPPPAKSVKKIQKKKASHQKSQSGKGGRLVKSRTSKTLKRGKN